MLLIAFSFIIIIFINMHLQSIYKYIVKSVDIQYQNSKEKKEKNIPDSLIQFWTAEKKAVFTEDKLSLPQISMCELIKMVSSTLLKSNSNRLFIAFT